MKLHVIYIRVTAGDREPVANETEIDVRETPHYYRAKGTNYKKDNLMKVDPGIWRTDDIDFIYIEILCLPEQRKEAMILLLQAVVAEFERRKSIIEGMAKQVETLKQLTEKK